jgi:imidazolonepropionase-like amidohydrolase
MAVIGRLHEGGVELIAGPDSGISRTIAHGRLAELITFFIDSGLSGPAALATATSAAAKACGVGTRKGFLRRGYDADVVVIDGDLADDPTALQNVRSVILGGTVVRG